MKQTKNLHEAFAQFFEKPTRETFRDLLRQHTGETNHLDFKVSIPQIPALAKHLIALANSHGGCIVVGVEEKLDKTLEAVGVQKIEDKSHLHKQLQRFIPPQIQFEILDFSFPASEYQTLIGKKFQVIIVEYDARYMPVLSLSDGDGIYKNAVYIRKGTSSESADYHELQILLNERISTEYSSTRELTLEEELSELKTLYGEVEGNRYRFLYANLNRVESNFSLVDESFQEFIARMINIKKQRIQKIIEKT